MQKINKDMEMIIEQLKNVQIDAPNISMEPIMIDINERMLINILKDTVDTSWGRDTLSEEIIISWLNNFSGKVFDVSYERILALILAVNVVYYNERDISYLSRVAYRKLIHEIMEKKEIELEEVIDSLIFFPLGTVSESGPFLAYYFRKENSLPTSFFASTAESIIQNNNKKVVVLLDDVSISGGQLTWYVDKLKKDNLLWDKIFQEKDIYSLMLISTNEAEIKMKEKGIKLCTPIIMDDRCKSFSENSAIYKMFDKTYRDILRLHTKYMAQKYGFELLLKAYVDSGEIERLIRQNNDFEQIRKRIINDSLGYSNAQALISFEYNTPNNTLPIIWIENDKWVPLFKRYEKMYTSSLIGGIVDDNFYI